MIIQGAQRPTGAESLVQPPPPGYFLLPRLVSELRPSERLPSFLEFVSSKFFSSLLLFGMATVAGDTFVKLKGIIATTADPFSVIFAFSVVKYVFTQYSLYRTTQIPLPSPLHPETPSTPGTETGP